MLDLRRFYTPFYLVNNFSFLIIADLPKSLISGVLYSECIIKPSKLYQTHIKFTCKLTNDA